MKLLYFAWVKDMTGIGEETVNPPEHITNVGELIEWLKLQTPAHAKAFAELKMIRCAVNQNYAQLDDTVNTNDEIAFFPPVTGG